MSAVLPLYIVSKGLCALQYQRQLVKWITDSLHVDILKITHVTSNAAIPTTYLKVVVDDDIRLYFDGCILGILERTTELLPVSNTAKNVIIILLKGTPHLILYDKRLPTTDEIAHCGLVGENLLVAVDDCRLLSTRNYQPSFSVTAVELSHALTTVSIPSTCYDALHRSVGEMLTCGICFEQHTQLQEVCVNHHHYCGVCARELKRCPHCRENLLSSV